MRKTNKKYTICEVLREINDIHQGDSEIDVITREKLAIAEQMAKRLGRKLLEYNKEHSKDWWEKNKNYEKNLKIRMSKTYCTGGKNGC